MRHKFSLSYSISCLLTIFSISTAFCSSPKPLVADPTTADSSRKSIEMQPMDFQLAPKTAENIRALSEIMKSGKVASAVAFPGGGIRGIIQAGIANYIEKKTGLSFSEIFHMMSGTSTGGIIAAALSAPSVEEPEKARMKASEIEELYMQRGREIFKEKTLFEKIISLFTSKYSEKPLEKILYEMCGDLKLSDALNDLMITIYNKTFGRGELMKSHFAREAAAGLQSLNSTKSIEEEGSRSSSSNEHFVEQHHAVTVSLTTSPVSEEDSHHTRAVTVTESVLAPPEQDETLQSSSSTQMQEEASPSSVAISPSDSESSIYSNMTYFDATLSGDNSKYRRDFLLRQLIRATSAAPSYYPVARISPIGGTEADVISAVDGGLFANDPTLFTLIEMFKLYPNADAYFLLTIGNGSPRYKEKPVRSILDIATQTPDLLMSNNSISQRHIMKVLGPQYNKPVYFAEFQMHIPAEHAEMDDVSPENMKYLQRVAQEYTQRTPLVDAIIDEILSSPRIPTSELVASANTQVTPSNFHMLK